MPHFFKRLKILNWRYIIDNTLFFTKLLVEDNSYCRIDNLFFTTLNIEKCILNCIFDQFWLWYKWLILSLHFLIRLMILVSEGDQVKNFFDFPMMFIFFFHFFFSYRHFLVDFNLSKVFIQYVLMVLWGFIFLTI